MYSLSAPGALANDPIVATVDVSDSVRADHGDDGGTLFLTGAQTVSSVELYVDCHPYEGATTCPPTVVVNTTDSASTTVTAVALQFTAPTAEGKHVIYIRAEDSYGYLGPVTAKNFITCSAATGCPFTTTSTTTTSTTTTTTTSTTGGGGGGITLSVNGYKVKGVQHADLTWGGAANAVNIKRDGNTIGNDATGSFTDITNAKGGGSYEYQVCDAVGTAGCSNPVTVVF